MTTGALIVAAGRGLRAVGDDSTELPKQYRNISGRPMLWHTLNVFLDHPKINFVLPVIHADDVALFQAASAGLDILLPPVFGGATRQQSVLAGLEGLIERKPEKILIHDGARPFVSPALIDRTLDALDGNQAVLPACLVTDTLRRGYNGLAADLVDRENLYASQTPQGFHYDAILHAHRQAAEQPDQSFTDDGEIARWAGLDVALVDGEVGNIKITRGEDFEMAANKLNPVRPHVRTGLGFDVHAFGPGDAVTICGVTIPHHAALRGHSDADVGLHAITDAILGAISAGDIGTHFPPSDETWKGADSTVFLQHAGKLAAAADSTIEHVDVTIICEVPKIGPHRDAMRDRIAEILKLTPDSVSVKATTTEKLGFTGRGEGIAAQAIATVYLP